MAAIPVHDHRLMLRTALKGLDEARLRFEAVSTPGAAAEDAFVPLSETLWWVVSADEAFKELAGNASGYHADTKSYERARDADPSGCVIAGLQYARNRCGHHRILVALEDGLGLPFVLPAVFGSFFRWRPSDQLPPPPPKYTNAELRRKYDAHLAGRTVTQTLDSADQWFVQQRQDADVLALRFRPRMHQIPSELAASKVGLAGHWDDCARRWRHVPTQSDSPRWLPSSANGLVPHPIS